MSNFAKKGQWVQIHDIVLTPEQRASQVPDDTRAKPLEMWVNGNIAHDAKVGEECEIITASGRSVKGTLCAVKPSYTFGFGEFVSELNTIRNEIRKAAGVQS